MGESAYLSGNHYSASGSGKADSFPCHCKQSDDNHRAEITGAGQFIKAVVLLYLSAIVIGGAVQLFRPWLRYAGLLYAAFAAGYVLFLTLWRSAASSGRQEEDVYPVTLYAGGKEKELYCFVGYRECSFRSGLRETL